MVVSKGAVEEFWGNADLAFLQENMGLKGQLMPGAPIVLGNTQDLLEAVRLSTEG